MPINFKINYHSTSGPIKTTQWDKDENKRDEIDDADVVKIKVQEKPGKKGKGEKSLESKARLMSRFRIFLAVWW